MYEIVNYKYLITYSHGENVWNKLRKSRKIGQQGETSIGAFAQFFSTIAKILFLEKRLGMFSRTCTQLWDFPKTFNFRRS